MWDIFESKIRTDVGVDDSFDEDEDLPEPPRRQELVNPGNIIDIPDPSSDDPGEFFIDPPVQPAEPLREWQKVLAGLDYPTNTVVITDQDITGIERRELDGQGWRSTESAPDDQGAVQVRLSRSELEDAIKSGLMGMAERLLDSAGHSSQFKGHIYAVLLKHVRAKFLDGASLGLAEEHHLETSWRMLDHIEQTIVRSPGLVEGMVKYAN